MHGTLDLGIGDAWISKGDEPDNDDKRGKTGLVVHRDLPNLVLLSLAELSNGGDRHPSRSDSRPVLDFIPFRGGAL